MNDTARRFAIAAAALVLLAGLSAPAARAAEHRLEVHIQGEDHGGLDLSLDGTLAAALIGALAPAHLNCDDGDRDPQTIAMMRYLEAHPDGSYRTWKRGEEVSAVRHGNRVELHVVDRHGETVNVEVPWSLARCVLGYPTRLGAALLSEDGLRIRIDGQEGSVHITLH